MSKDQIKLSAKNEIDKAMKFFGMALALNSNYFYELGKSSLNNADILMKLLNEGAK